MKMLGPFLSENFICQMTENKVNYFLNPDNYKKESQMSHRIEKVIKRDGTVEDFAPEKLNGWAEYGCKTVDVSWSAITMAAQKTLPKGVVDSDTLMDALIKAAESLIKDNPAYDVPAKELRLAQMRKRLYDSFEPPSLRFFHDHMVSVGAWEDMSAWITDEQFEALNQVIDHDRDRLFTSGGLKQFFDKYSRRNIATGEIYETPQFAYMGMAMAMLSQPNWTILDAIDLYNAMSLHKINVPTPPLVGLRSSDRGFASCCLVDSTDTLDSIDTAEHIVFKMVAARAGIGYHLESRSIADPVRNGAFPHSGKLPYYRHIDRSVKANTQQTRGGSATVSYPYFDPEIIQLMQVKQQRATDENKIDKMDYSLSFNNLLLKRYLKNEDITLMSYFYAPEVHEAFYSDDEAKFEEIYVAAEKRVASLTKIDHEGKTVPAAPKVSAKEILDTWLRIRMETGRMYAHHIGESNRHGNFLDPIRMTNLCVAPETKILTKNGNIEIIDLVGKEVEIWNGQEWSTVIPAKTGEAQELMKITFSDGSTIESTLYHKFYHQPKYVREDRRTSFKQGLEEVRAVDLQVGMKMPKFSNPIVDHGNMVLKSPYTNGFFTGDGTYGRHGEPKLYFYEKGSKLPLVDKIDAEIQGSGLLDSAGRLSYIVKSDLMPKYFVPGPEYTIDSRIKWLEGYLDADGCIQKNGTTPSIVVASAEPDFLSKVKDLLLELGVTSKIILGRKEGDYELPDGTGTSKLYHCRETSRLIVGSNGFWKLKDLGLSLDKEKLLNLTRPNRDATRFVTVTNVEFTGRISDTYCFTEPKLNLGVFNGILAGNCVEITQPTRPFHHITELYKTKEQLDQMKPEDIGEVSLCNLGGVVLGRMESLAEWEKTCYILLKFVDTIIEIQDYPFPTMEYTAKKRRNVGIGLMNAAGAMAAEGLAYEGVEARNWIHREAEKLSYFLHKASVRLAKEQGACEWFNRTKPSKGTLVIDTYKKTVDELVSVGLEMDWESLRADILKYGMRNSVLTAQMPGESSSVLLGVTNSIEPPRKIVSIKGSAVNKVIAIAPGATDWDTLMSYKLAYDIDRTEWIKWNAVYQKFLSQSSSFQMYYDYSKFENEIIPGPVVVRDFMTAVKYGIKTWYYANFNTANGGGAGEEAAGCASGGCQL